MDNNSIKLLSEFTNYYWINTWSYFVQSLLETELYSVIFGTDWKEKAKGSVSALKIISWNRDLKQRRSISHTWYTFIEKHFIPYINYLTIWTRDFKKLKLILYEKLDTYFSDFDQNSIINLSRVAKESWFDKTDLLMFIFSIKLMKILVDNLDNQPRKFLIISKPSLKEIKMIIEKLRLLNEINEAKNTISQSEKYNSIMKMIDLWTLWFKELTLDASPDYFKKVDRNVLKLVKLLFTKRFKPKSQNENFNIWTQINSTQYTQYITQDYSQKRTKSPNYNPMHDIKKRRPKRWEKLFKANQQIRSEWFNTSKIENFQEENSISLPLDHENALKSINSRSKNKKHHIPRPSPPSLHSQTIHSHISASKCSTIQQIYPFPASRFLQNPTCQHTKMKIKKQRRNQFRAANMSTALKLLSDKSTVQDKSINRSDSNDDILASWFDMIPPGMFSQKETSNLNVLIEDTDEESKSDKEEFLF